MNVDAVGIYEVDQSGQQHLGHWTLLIQLCPAATHLPCVATIQFNQIQSN